MKSLYLLLFLTAWVHHVLPVYWSYLLIREGRNWTDARAYCRDRFTDLAIIHNIQNMEQFQRDSQRQNLGSSAWIGLYNDVNRWRWSLGNEPVGRWVKWVGSEPNNGGGNQECVTMNNYGWSDKKCTLTVPFVCFDESKIGDARYIFISNMVTWSEAQSYCRHYHTDLASTRDETEFLTVRSFSVIDTWIGLFRDSWKWVDKSNFSTVSWMSGQPNNGLRNENCGYVNNSMAGDARCSELKPFICYSEIRHKQVLKLKVRSDQDMKDPAVQLVILEQIKQKMKDGGIAGNITVKWRKQPDGLVFHKEDRNDTTQ